MPDQLQPVVMVSLRYLQLWDANEASRNTTMVLETQKTSTQPRAFDELFDIVHWFDTLLSENPNLHCEVHVGQAHTAEPAERGGCQAPRQAAPVPGSPPATDLHSDVAFSKGCLLPVWRLPSASCWLDDGMTIQKREIECLLYDSHQKGKMMIMRMKTSGSRVDSPVAEGNRKEGGGRKMRDLHKDT